MGQILPFNPFVALVNAWVENSQNGHVGEGAMHTAVGAMANSSLTLSWSRCLQGKLCRLCLFLWGHRHRVPDIQTQRL